MRLIEAFETATPVIPSTHRPAIQRKLGELRGYRGPAAPWTRLSAPDVELTRLLSMILTFRAARHASATPSLKIRCRLREHELCAAAHVLIAELYL
jgi:hypothetical protein